MFDRIGRGWALAVQSWRVLKKDKPGCHTHACVGMWERVEFPH